MPRRNPGFDPRWVFYAAVSEWLRTLASNQETRVQFSPAVLLWASFAGEAPRWYRGDNRFDSGAQIFIPAKLYSGETLLVKPRPVSGLNAVRFRAPDLIL